MREASETWESKVTGYIADGIFLAGNWGVDAPRMVTPRLPMEASLKGLHSPPTFSC